MYDYSIDIGNRSIISDLAFNNYYGLFKTIKGIDLNQIPDYIFQATMEDNIRTIVDTFNTHGVDTNKIKHILCKNDLFNKQFYIAINKDFGDYIRIYSNNLNVKIKTNKIFEKKCHWGDNGKTCFDYLYFFKSMKSNMKYIHIWYLLTIIKDIAKETMGYIYIIKNNDQYKIGKTIDFANRYKTYQRTENPYPYETILCENVFDYSNLEKQLHKQFSDKNTRGEWFALSREEVDEVKAIINSNKITV